MVHPLLTLTLAVCCAYLLWRDSHRAGFGRFSMPDPERLSAHEDTPVRTFLNVKWLGGDYELPAGEDHCVVALLRFEDGKFRGVEQAKPFSPQPGRSRVVPFYVMWGPSPKGTRVIEGWPGSWISTDDRPFFDKLDFGLTRAYGNGPLGELRGWRVIGMATSREVRAGREEFARVNSNDVQIEFENRKYMLVLGVKPFPTEKEAYDWAYTHREPPDP